VSPDRTAFFQKEFREDLRAWVKRDRAMAVRVLDLVAEVLRDPCAGTGRPQPLANELTGVWTRRIAQEHRLVYKVSEKRIDFLQARYHY
jgi:toxin YoeB